MQLLNEKSKISLERNLEKYRKKLEGIPEEAICEVAPEVGVPIAEKLSYVTNEELSEMYTELLAKASQHKTSNIAHPSFANIINNLSPDEAILVKYFSKNQDIPIIEARWQYKNSTQYVLLFPLIVHLSCNNSLVYPNQIYSYISNLQGLGIIDLNTDRFSTNTKAYRRLEEYAEEKYLNLTKNLDSGDFKFIRGVISLNQYGEIFTQACCK